jgi:hypothetical protein
MSSENIKDITLKMERVKKIPVEEYINLFLEMCDVGIDLYIQEEKKRYPEKTSTEIMKEYHLRHDKR